MSARLQTTIAHLPLNVLRRIYLFAHGDDIVEIEVDNSGTLHTGACKLLRVCQEVRQSLLEACRQGNLRLVYTVRSPISLRKLFAQAILRSGQLSVRLVLLAELEDSKLTEAEEHGALEGDHVQPVFKAWREVFRDEPRVRDIHLVYFDLVRSFRLDPRGVAKVIQNLSTVLRSRSAGAAKCRIMGCRTVQGRAYVESFTLNVIPTESSTPDGKRVNPNIEFMAGPHPVEEAPVCMSESEARALSRREQRYEAPSVTPIAGTKRKSSDI